MFNEPIDQNPNQVPKDIQSKKEAMRDILEKNLATRRQRLEEMQQDAARRPSLIIMPNDKAAEETGTPHQHERNSVSTTNITPLNSQDLFAKLALASKEERIKLHDSITHHFTSTLSKIFTMDAAGNCVAITKLYNNPKPATYEQIILATLADNSVTNLEDFTHDDLAQMLQARLKHFDEATWIRLTLLCDSCGDEQFSTLYKAAQTLVAKEENEDEITRFHAFLFLRSQKQHSAFILSDDDLAPLLRKHIKEDDFFYKIVTTFRGYALAKNTIQELIKTPTFSIVEYYDAASEEFKNLNESLLAIQLYAYYHRDYKIEPDVKGRLETLHLRLEKSPKLYESSPLYLKSRILDQIIKNNGDKRKTTRMIGNIFTQVTTGTLLSPTQVQTLFLRSLLEHLMNKGLETPTITSEQIPFIVSFYERYVQKKRAKQEKGMTNIDLKYDTAKINEWLIERLEIVKNTEFQKLLLLLPEQFREALFSFEGSAINPVSLQAAEAYAQQPAEPKRRPSLMSAFLFKKTEAVQPAEASIKNEDNEKFVEHPAQAYAVVSELFARRAEQYVASNTAVPLSPTPGEKK